MAVFKRKRRGAIMKKSRQVMFSDFQWCQIHYPKYGNPPTLHLEDRHGCVLPVGDVRIVNALIRVLQGAVIEMRKGKQQSRTVYRQFYCCECFHQQHGIPCKPEDGAIMGHCPKCDKRMTLISGNHAKRTMGS